MCVAMVPALDSCDPSRKRGSAQQWCSPKSGHVSRVGLMLWKKCSARNSRVSCCCLAKMSSTFPTRQHRTRAAGPSTPATGQVLSHWHAATRRRSLLRADWLGCSPASAPKPAPSPCSPCSAAHPSPSAIRPTAPMSRLVVAAAFLVTRPTPRGNAVDNKEWHASSRYTWSIASSALVHLWRGQIVHFFDEQTRSSRAAITDATTSARQIWIHKEDSTRSPSSFRQSPFGSACITS